MISSDDFTLDMLSDPSQLASVVIDAMENAEAGNQLTINDPNNGFVMMLLGQMAVFSKFSEKIDRISSFLYPQRARTSEQVFPHLAEFDYVRLMAQPASLDFVFAISKRWIVDNAVPFDSNYNKLVVPAGSTFTMGGIPYSTYYPIDILVNRNTGAVTAFYNTDELNTLFTNTTNMLIDDQTLTRDGIEYYQMVFPTYQFGKDTNTYTVGVEQGFSQTLTYTDKFYAAKVFTMQGGVWKQIDVSLDKLFYDYQTPTALLTLTPETQKVKIDIPKVYFNNGQITKTIKIELYSTKGAVNYSLSIADVTGLEANFNTQSSVFSAPLAQIPIYDLIPRVTEVAGGADPMTAEEIRDAVVKRSLYDRVAVTGPELFQAFQKAGFTPNRVIDDVTDRMYFASNILRDGNGVTVPTLVGDIHLADDALKGNPSTIISYSDGYYTILPTTTFVAAAAGTTVRPMSDAEVEIMNNLDKTALVAELNSGRYLRQAFHITLLSSPKSPQAFTYNLLSPSVDNLLFIAENSHSAPQLSAISCDVVHLQHGTGGYQIFLNMVRSANIDDWTPNMFSVGLRCNNKLGNPVFFPATFVETVNGVDRWVVNLKTTYHISTDDYITVEGENTDGKLETFDIKLIQTFTLFSSFNRQIAPTIPIELALNAFLPDQLAQTDLVMMAQEVHVIFGVNLSNEIYCGVNTSWGNDIYLTAQDTVYYQTEAPVFQTDDTGKLVYRINDGNVETVTLYEMDSTPPFTGDLQKTLLDDVAAGSAAGSYRLDDTKGLLVGMAVRGTNVPVGAKIASVDGNLITLTLDRSAKVSKGTVFTFTNTSFVIKTTQDQTSANKTLTVASTSGMLKGQSVIGFDIPAGTTIANIPSSTKITLSVATTAVVKTDTVITIVNASAPGVVKTAKGSVISDVTGKPIIVKAAQNQHLIPAILFDGKMFASDDQVDLETVESVSETLTNFATQIRSIDQGLLESSDVYYRPLRTMGFANFSTGGGKTLSLNLQLGFSVTIYVDPSVYNSQTLLLAMEETALLIFYEALSRDIISVGEIGEDIRERLGSGVVAVEMGPISGVEDLRLIALQDANCSPSIGRVLSIEADGSLIRKPDVSITFLPKPDTSTTKNLKTA